MEIALLRVITFQETMYLEVNANVSESIAKLVWHSRQRSLIACSYRA